MEINGVPLHPLVVHAAVVFGPLAALAALGYVALPAWRDRLRWPMLVLAVVASGAIVTAYFTGLNLLQTRPELQQIAGVDTHKSRGTTLFWFTLPFAAVAVASGLLHERTGAVRILLNVLLGLAALAVLGLVVATGDAGAHAVWGT
jgi:lipopolysaccharide export LptBFGC system permease protein LptF